MLSESKLLNEVPFINNRDDLRQYIRPLYIIEDYLEDAGKYKMFASQLYNIIKGCFVIRECREYPIRFKFTRKSEETYTIQFRHFVINVFLWFPFTELSGINVLNSSFILDCSKDIPKLENYINTKLIVVLRDHHIKSTKINYAISEVLYNLRMFSKDFSLILGLTISIGMFEDLYKNPEIRDIMECSFDDNMQPHEIEAKIDEYQNRLIDLLMHKTDSHLGVILQAGTGIKHKQLSEFMIAEGLKPTIDGKTIPLPIQNSTLIRGVDRPSYLYLNALAARKSLVMNKKVMGKAGYFGKIVLMLARTLSMSKNTSDCGSTHYVHYDVKNKDILKRLNGKYYKLSEDQPLERLDGFNDKKLIGKTVMVRSAATCRLRNHVCPKCIGYTAVANEDISDGIAAFESEEITKVINQSILSTKHLLTTNSEVIDFNADFYDFFTITGGEINPNVNDNQKVKNIEDYAIYIKPEDIIKMEEMDDDSLYNTCIENGCFYIKNLANPKQDDIVIKADGDKEIFISEEALELMKKGKGLIKFRDLDDDIKLFEMVIYNNELTKPLYELMNLLNKKRSDTIDETIDSMSNKFVELLVESKISANIVAAEFIINRLIRSKDDVYERPDFTNDELEPYDILTVSAALEKNPSPLIGLSYQNLKRQILSDELYSEKRHATSYLDPFFKTEIPTKNLKRYAKIVEENTDSDFMS